MINNWDDTLINVDNLQSWAVKSSHKDVIVDSQKTFSFPVRQSLNTKICLSKSKVSKLEADVLVLPFNEMRQMRSSLASEILKSAGTDFVIADEQISDIKTGDIVSTTSCDLPCRYVFHALEPIVSHLYKTATETALHNCYRNALELAKTLQLRSIVFCPLYTTSDQLLYIHLTHITIRTLRCCMNQYEDSFDKVVLAVNEDSLLIYEQLLSVYFPRNYNELSNGESVVNNMRWNLWGESLYADRVIRITNVEALKQFQNKSPEKDLISQVNRVSFAEMSGDHDKRRKWELRIKEDDVLSKQRIYARLLRQSRMEDLSEVEHIQHAIKVSGVDRQGSPILVIIAEYIHRIRADPEKAIKYIIQKYDKLTNLPYNIVYFSTGAENQISPEFLKRILRILDLKYIRNLKKLYVVHSTLAHKIYSFYFCTMYAHEVRKKLTFVKSLSKLFNFAEETQLTIPEFIHDFEKMVNPTMTKAYESK